MGPLCRIIEDILGISLSMVLMDTFRNEDISIMVILGLDFIKSKISFCLVDIFLPSFLPSSSSAFLCMVDFRGKETTAIVRSLSIVGRVPVSDSQLTNASSG